MKSCIILCYEELESSMLAFESLKKHYLINNTPFPFSIKIGLSRLDVPFRFWLLLLFDEEHLDLMDQWTLEAQQSLPLNSREIYVGKPRLKEYDEHTKTLTENRLENGIIKDF